ncbi:hypothetical protein CFC21_044802 [Triticum aestivum]|uniref:Ankyrin repeat-containing protein n=3 Tax=Triticum TaxID=4564 RepID=A0A9R1S9H4_TRITD|nr:ankyrin repeat-containing protein ITN1-like isoform X1 [Triticum aestivum]KAF7033723.1 hypothetical protein CFC21_044802 [Triticum aestivum]VAH86095.1 unnamed protein product [Triticum turgidum subsp. durum]
MATNTSATDYSSAGTQPQIDRRLLEAATSGDPRRVKELVSRNPSIILGTTPQGNSCLHISSMHGHKEFCEDVLEIEESLLLNANFESFLSKLNLQGETPLVTAVTHGHAFVASFLVGRCHRLGLRQVILQQDKTGCNALHHAIHSGHKELALELIAAEPALSRDVNKFKESPLFLAVMRDFCDVVEKLVRITDSAHGGEFGLNALHGAVRNDNPVIARQIMETRPELAREGNTDLVTPIRMAVRYGKMRVVRELLRHDFSLGYEMHKNIFPLLNCAAAGGQVNVAQEILRHCPDAPYREIGGETRTCLHIAVLNNHIEFVKFILSTPYLRKLVNMQDSNRKTALHYAVQGCYPKIIAALLSHEDIDRAVLDNSAKPTAWELWINTYCAKSINWNNVWMLKLKGRPQNTMCLQNIHGDVKQGAINESSGVAKSPCPLLSFCL